MIVITGATGQLGRLVIKALLKKVPASNIVAAVRNVEKAKDSPHWACKCARPITPSLQAWDAALKGADKVLLISSSEIGQRAKQHKAVIDAAKRAGVKLLAYTSVLRADTSPLGLAAEHKETEAAISAPPAFPSYCCATAGTPRTTRQASPAHSHMAQCMAARATAAFPRPPVPTMPKQMSPC